MLMMLDIHFPIWLQIYCFFLTYAREKRKKSKNPSPDCSTDGHRQSDRAELFTRSRERVRKKKALFGRFFPDFTLVLMR